jgi:hypothetical protein
VTFTTLETRVSQTQFNPDLLNCLMDRLSLSPLPAPVSTPANDDNKSSGLQCRSPFLYSRPPGSIPTQCLTPFSPGGQPHSTSPGPSLSWEVSLC